MATTTSSARERGRRREQLLELTARLSDDFATRAAQHDREGSYPFENVQRMRETGYLSLTVPESFGGLGAGMVDMMHCLERMAQGCGSTALAVALHASYLGYVAEEWHETGSPKLERFLQACGPGNVVLCGAMSESETGGRIVHNTTSATRVDGGFVINGKKIFCTSSPAMTHFRSSASWASPEGPRLVNYLIPRDTPGLVRLDDWDTMGMRATGSNSHKLQDMFVSDDQVWVIREPGVWDTYLMKMFFWGWMAIPVVYLGIAQAMRNFSAEWARKRARFPAPRPVMYEPGVQAAVARMDADLASARTLLYSVGEAWEAGTNWSLDEAFGRSVQAKFVVMQNVMRVAHEAFYLVGGSAYFKALPIERMYRDVVSGPFHALNFDDAQEALGKRAFGIPEDVQPRWG